MRIRSIQTKVLAVIAALIFVLVTFLTSYFLSRQIDTGRRNLADEVSDYAGLLSRQVEPGVAFDDRETVREAFVAAEMDPDVSALALYSEDGRLVETTGEFWGGSVPAFRHADGLILDSKEDYVRGIAPVVSKEGPRGTLYIELRTAALDAERAHVIRLACVVGALALVLGFVAAWGIGHSLAKRIRVIADAARAVAAGDLTRKPIHEPSGDEIGHLAGDFNVMSANIRSLLTQIRAANERETERLDELVRERTRQLDARTKDMRLVLDHIAQGLFTIDREGRISPERSRAFDEWLGTPSPGATLWKHVEAHDPVLAARFQEGWQAVIDDVLPLELALDQMPKMHRHLGRHHHFEYRPILDANGALSRVLAVVSDVTSEVERESSDAAQRDLMEIFRRASTDRSGFLELVAEVDVLIRDVSTSTAPTPEMRRALHTLKGACASFGLSRMTALCHEMETFIEDTASLPSQGMLADLVHIWSELTSKMVDLAGELTATRMEIEKQDYQELLEKVAAGASHAQVYRELALWRLEPTSRRLERIARHAQGIAAKLGRPNVRIVTVSNGVRLDSASWAPFWTAFVHVLRNALDHGIEPAAEREAAGKPVAGTLVVRTYYADTDLCIEASDDGRGIDWEGLAERGRMLGLPAKTAAQIENLIFENGVSTRASITEHSGRGIGMSAVRSAAVHLGGRVEIASSRGKGTTVRFRFSTAAASLARPATQAVA